jgi:hypothetical protein
MAGPDDCIEPLIEATGGRMTREEIAALLRKLMEKAENPGMARDNFASPRDRLMNAAGQLVEQAKELAAIKKRNEADDKVKQLVRRQTYDNAPNPVLGIEAKTVGVNAPFDGARQSVDATRRQLQRDLIAGLESTLHKEDLDKLFGSHQLETEWTRELFEINKGKHGSPGISGNAQAKRIAEIVHQYQRQAVDGLNREGAWIKSYTGYITKTTHDPDRVRRAGREAWVDRTLQLIDIERTFGTPFKARQALNDLWVEFKNGNHLRFDEGQLDDLAFASGLNMAKKVSAHRELHFKSAEDWLAYTGEFGSGKPTEIVIRSLEQAARSTALMREFGTNPRAAFDADIAYLKDKHKGTDAHQQIVNAERWLNNQFGLLDGSSNHVTNRTAANLTSGWMSIQRMSKLGLTPISMLVDLATKASELRYQGMDVVDRWGGGITGYFKGAEGSAKREVAELLLAGMESRIGYITSHFDGMDAPRGLIARAERTFFKITGISKMTDNQRADAEVMMARHLGMQRGKSWAEAPEELRRLLPSYGIGESEWALFHKVDWLTHPENGRVYLTPQDVKALPDHLVEGYLRTTGALGEKSSDAAITRGVEKGREDLALKLAAFYSDRGQYAIIDVGVRERAILLQGTNPGSPLGIGLRLFAQFKAFPTAMITKTWGREIYGGQGRMGAIAGLAELAVSTYVLGALANMLNEYVKGRDGLARWRNDPVKASLAAFVKGGFGSIYGDFLLGEWDRHGKSALASLAGPTIGQTDSLFTLFSQMTAPLKDSDESFGTAATTALRMGRENLPGMNMIYTKAAFDYLIFYRLQEAMNPGYLRRMERAQKNNSGIEYWLKPSQTSR